MGIFEQSVQIFTGKKKTPEEEEQEREEGGEESCCSRCCGCCTCPSVCRSWVQYLYVEPVVFLYNLAYYAFITLNTEYFYNKKMEEHWPNCSHPIKCDHGDIPRHIDFRVSMESSDLSLLSSVARGLPSLFSSLIIVSLSDRYGRKFALIVPNLGAMIRQVGYIAAEWFDWGVNFLMVTNLVEGILGYQQCLVGAAFLYLGDTVDLESRSFRFLVVQVLVMLADSLGNIPTGYMLDYVSWIGCFFIMLAVHVLALIWTLFIPDSKGAKGTKEGAGLSMAETMQSFKIYGKKRENSTYRPYLILLAVMMCINGLLSSGETVLDTQYLIGPPFYFTPVAVGVFLCVQALVWGLGPLLLHKPFVMCKLDDFWMVMVGHLSFGLTHLTFGLAESRQWVYISVVFGMYGGAILGVGRSLMTKLVKEEEQAALQATVSSILSVGGAISNVMLLGIYGETVLIHPGLTFIIVGAIFLTMMAALGIFHIYARCTSEYTPLTESKKVPDNF